MTLEERWERETNILHALEELWHHKPRFTEDDFCRLCTKEMTINDMRSKVGLAPLSGLEYDELFLLEPSGYIPMVGLDYVRKAREYGEASNSDKVREFFESSRDFSERNISKFLSWEKPTTGI